MAIFRPTQFRIQDLLIATFLFAVMTVTAPTVRRVLPEYRMSMIWIMVVVAGTSARWVGWRLCWPPGSVGRHAVAFFFAFAGSAAMIMVLICDGSLSRLMRDIPDGLGAFTLLSAIFTAAIIESALWLLTSVWAAIGEGGSAQVKVIGEQRNAHESRSRRSDN